MEYDTGGGRYFPKIPYPGVGGVVGGVFDPQNCKIQKVPRVLFEKAKKWI